MSEPFEPEYVRPAQADCPNCTCCTVNLCVKGASSILECFGLTSEDTRSTVSGCPCSSEETRGTAAWRAGRLRVTMRATQHPLAVDVEATLRAVAAGEDVADYAEQVNTLALLRYVAFVDSRPVITELGVVYLTTLTELRSTTPVQVETVDVATGTARVVVVGWSLTDGVTVLLNQLVGATQLKAEELPGRLLEATANCGALEADDVVLTDIVVAPPLPASGEGEADRPSPAVQGRDESGCVDGAPAGGEA
ncbi:hypothetical protein [Streptomyces sp. NPDC007346]|uniref:hypothetical protein n=1 Tax=Streptomyces sp. NPDC007346 TaxID=3154682 RepID=UPI00345198D8